MSDLWPDFSAYKNEENKAISILREQARALEKKTNKRVRATFSKIKYYDNTFQREFYPDIEEVIDDQLKDKMDFNEKFQRIEYRFEIFNDTYHFRIFTVDYKLVFPISIKVDGGIEDDLPENTNFSINSNAELENLLRLIFNSEKLKFIIHQMMRDEK